MPRILAASHPCTKPLQEAHIQEESLPEAILKPSSCCIDASADVNAKDNLGKTPLREAVWQVDPEVVRLLIETGADINVKDIDDDTPLHEVATGLMLYQFAVTTP